MNTGKIVLKIQPYLTATLVTVVIIICSAPTREAVAVVRLLLSAAMKQTRQQAKEEGEWLEFVEKESVHKSSRCCVVSVIAKLLRSTAMSQDRQATNRHNARVELLSRT